MSVTIIHKKGSGIPSADSLEVAEIAVDVVTGKLYTKTDDGNVVEISGSSDGSGGGGLVHIGEAPPTDPQEGQEWLKLPADGSQASMWVYDGEKWLQQPSNGSGGGGASVHIGEAPPVDPQEGEQWLETPADGDAAMWVWDGEKWLQHPSGGSGGDIDTSNLVQLDQINDVVEGNFSLVWDDSANANFPFNGRIGYDGNNSDPDSVGGSFLYAKGTRGTVSIGRDGDMELHGPSEIRGVPDREGNLPWITDFSYVQAADFRDADGNSIVGDDLHISYTYNEESGGWEFDRPGGGRPVITFDTSGGAVFDNGVESYEWLKGKKYIATDGNIYARDGYVQASDFRDADGNSIVGGGGGGSGDGLPVEYFEKTGIPFDRVGDYSPDSEIEHLLTVENVYWVKSDDGELSHFDESYGKPANIYATTGYFNRAEIDGRVVAQYLGTSSHWLGGANSQSVSSVNLVGGKLFAVEVTAFGGINIPAADEERPDIPFELLEEGDEKKIAEYNRSIQYALTVTHETLGRTVEIDKEGIIRANQFTDMAGNPMSVSPATMVDAFTTLQAAIADEDTLEGVKTALTNALGGLIEKFEAYQVKQGI